MCWGPRVSVSSGAEPSQGFRRGVVSRRNPDEGKSQDEAASRSREHLGTFTESQGIEQGVAINQDGFNDSPDVWTWMGGRASLVGVVLLFPRVEPIPSQSARAQGHVVYTDKTCSAQGRVEVRRNTTAVSSKLGFNKQL